MEDLVKRTIIGGERGMYNAARLGVNTELTFEKLRALHKFYMMNFAVDYVNDAYRSLALHARNPTHPEIDTYWVKSFAVLHQHSKICQLNILFHLIIDWTK